MAKQSPLQKINTQFGSKKDLATKLAAVLEPNEGESKEDLAARLLHVANAKLIHLEALVGKVEKHGGRAGLIETIAKHERKQKDADFRKSLESRTLGWLVDRVEMLEHRAKSAKPAPAKP
ncbi:hypothetical protein ACNOYE_06455 [Nannocystaceae bacterium ST9]